MSSSHTAPELLQRKKELYHQILDVTKAQSQILAGDDVTPIIESLDSRQALFGAVDEVNNELSALAEYPGDDSSLLGLYDELDLLLNEIIKHDNGNIGSIGSLSEKLKDQMRKLNVGRKQNKSYERSFPQGAAYFDQLK